MGAWALVLPEVGEGSGPRRTYCPFGLALALGVGLVRLRLRRGHGDRLVALAIGLAGTEAYRAKAQQYNQ